MTDASVPVALSFNRAAHCRRIGAHGGAVTVARHGTHHMRAIGTAGAHVTIQRHGIAYFQGLMQHKGWQGRRPVSFGVDLAAGRFDAKLAAQSPEGWPDDPRPATIPEVLVCGEYVTDVPIT